MAISVLSQASNDVGNTADITITKPTGTVDGNLLVAVIYQADGSRVNTLSGWTLIVDGSGSGRSVAAFYKVASSEGASYTWTGVGATKVGVILRISGHDSSSPILTTSTANGGSSGTSAPSLSITTARDASYLIYAPCSVAITSFSSYTSPLAEIYDLGTGQGLDGTLAVAGGEQVTAGASGSKTATCAASSDQRALMFAIQPPSSYNPAIARRRLLMM